MTDTRGDARPRVCLVALALGAMAAPAAASLPTGQWPLAARGSLRAPLAWQQSTGQRRRRRRARHRRRSSTAPSCAATSGPTPARSRATAVDDDGDGFVDDVHGADFVNGDGTPADDNGHGTHVAGIIAAPRARARPGAGRDDPAGEGARRRQVRQRALLAQGIDYAVAHGARILNVSVNGDGDERRARGRHPRRAGRRRGHRRVGRQRRRATSPRARPIRSPTPSPR